MLQLEICEVKDAKAEKSCLTCRQEHSDSVNYGTAHKVLL